ncbi:hypothetical protein [Paraburkholderia kirstenboschensis]|uniref:hypothetical protein n=1 Tax=Paraburkholderia kirstenboschensis TaxID=1245436 RepID=UPI000FFC86AF|nr:hypothetical protein [Paraburkholderia kirstenboschensis]
MKPVTVDMLRAHLMVASLTAVAAEVLACVTVAFAPEMQHMFVSTVFRLVAIAVMVISVVITRQLAHAAFHRAAQGGHTSAGVPSGPPVAVASHCPQRWLVILHLRLTGRPFTLAGH